MHKKMRTIFIFALLSLLVMLATSTVAAGRVIGGM